MKKIISLLVALVMAAVLAGCGGQSTAAVTTAAPETTPAQAETVEETTEAEPVKPFGDMADGVYTYVADAPEGDEVQFDYNTGEVFWKMGSASGSFLAIGDVYNFFEELAISDRPMYDWLASNFRSTEGFEGNLDGQLTLTIEGGLLSGIAVTDGTANAVAVITKDIVAPDLLIAGATRGQPNLLQSSITVIGSANCIEFTAQGNGILNNVTLYGNEEGVGLKASKIGGDVFVVGTLYADAEIQWFSRYGNIQAIKSDSEATIETNGQDIQIRGANVGRMRCLNLKSNGGDIIIGTEVSNDYARGAELEDKTTGTLSFSSTGFIDAGAGDVLIGTNTERIVSLDIVGDITANNVTIKPTNNGTVADVLTSIGNIDAAGDVEIVVGNINAANGPSAVIGDITAGGNVTIQAAVVNGYVGEINAGGDAKVTMSGCANKAELSVKGTKTEVNVGDEFGANLIDAYAYTGSISVNGQNCDIPAYTINGAVCVDVRDIVDKLQGTAKESYISWTGKTSGTLTINTGKSYATSNLKDYTPSAGKATETAKAAETKVNAVYVDSVLNTPVAYSVDGGLILFRLDDIAGLLGLNVGYADSGIDITLAE